MKTASNTFTLDKPESPLLAALLRHYEQLTDHVRRHVAGLGGDSASAREVVHEVCIELIESPPRQDIHTPLAFLRQVAKRRAIDRYRAEVSRQRFICHQTANDATVPDAPSDQPDLTRVVAGRQQVQALVLAIEALPPRCRDVFVLHKIHELSQLEVADYLGISIKTVEKHLRLAVAACREALGDL